MKKLIVVLGTLLMVGCATNYKQEPMWDWCYKSNGDLSDTRQPLRTAGCPTVTSGHIDQSHLRGFQSEVGIRTKNVKIVK